MTQMPKIEFSAAIDDRQLIWEGPLELEQMLSKVAAWDSKTQWMKWDLSVEPASWITQLFWKIFSGSSFLRSLFFGVDLEKSRLILNQLRQQVEASGDAGLCKLLHRAVRNFNETATRHRADPVQVFAKHYRQPDFTHPKMHHTVEIGDSEVTVTGELRIERREGVRADSPLILDCYEQEILSIEINGEAISSYTQTNFELIIPTIPADKEFDLKVVAKPKVFNNTSLRGFYKTGDVLATDFEPEEAKRFMVCFDRPDVRSEMKTTLIADKQKYPFLLSNGNLIDQKELSDGRHKVVWHNPIPDPSYLKAVVAGDFSVLEDTFNTQDGREVSLEIYTPPGEKDKARYAMLAAKQWLAYEERENGLVYPHHLENLKMVALEDYLYGAMENTSLIIFNDTSLLLDPETATDMDYRKVAHVVAHETAHTWSGNSTGPRSFFHGPLKESFTELRATRFIEWLYGSPLARPEQVDLVRTHQFPQDAGPTAHSIQPTSYVAPDDVYSPTSYNLGCEVMRVLWQILVAEDRDHFRKFQQQYFEDYHWKSVTFKELIHAATKATGIDLTTFERWFHKVGTPTVRFEMEYKDGKATIHVQQSIQGRGDGREQPPLHIPVFVELLSSSGERIVREILQMKEEELTVTYACDEKPVPVFMHALSAPVKIEYPYSDEDLAIIMKFCTDCVRGPDAGTEYAKRHIAKIFEALHTSPGDRPSVDEAVIQTFRDVLTGPLGVYSKALLLKLPTEREIMEGHQFLDFERASVAIRLFKTVLAEGLKDVLEKTLDLMPDPPRHPEKIDSFGSEMEVRELRTRCLDYLLHLPDSKYKRWVTNQFDQAENGNSRYTAALMLPGGEGAEKEHVLQNYLNLVGGSKRTMNLWLTAQSKARGCTVADLKRMASTPGVDMTNPNHVRSIAKEFVESNLGAYHDSKGEGYRYLADLILEVDKVVPDLAVNGMGVPAFQDYRRLCPPAKARMKEQLERIQGQVGISSRLKNLMNQLLGSSVNEMRV